MQEWQWLAKIINRALSLVSTDYFTELENSFHLTWETEYDESIEDNLYSRFPLGVAGNIPAIMKTLKLQYEQWHNRKSLTI